MKHGIIIGGLVFVISLSAISCESKSKSDMNVPTEYCEELVKLAEGGNAEAQANLGVCYAKGEGVSQSNEEAVRWFKMSVEQNNAKGQFYLAMAYNRGMGVNQDWQESFRLIKESANQGYAKAQTQLAGCYDYGLNGITKNHAEAMKWFRLAAEQGEPDAQWNVGMDYYTNKDYNEAFKWFDKSAAQGYSDGQLFLGMCYFLGQGVEQDKVRGYDLVRKAAEQGNKDAIQELELLKNNM